MASHPPSAHTPAPFQVLWGFLYVDVDTVNTRDVFLIGGEVSNILYFLTFLVRMGSSRALMSPGLLRFHCHPALFHACICACLLNDTGWLPSGPGLLALPTPSKRLTLHIPHTSTCTSKYSRAPSSADRGSSNDLQERFAAVVTQVYDVESMEEDTKKDAPAGVALSKAGVAVELSRVGAMAVLLVVAYFMFFGYDLD
jgi:hypothetical protein